ncbi:MAG TPA: hypothetical protein VF743_03325, partial [Acidimicrobiales bacterium]
MTGAPRTTGSAGELSWEPPGGGVWWLARELFPRPVSGLFAALFPPVTVGCARGADRLGLPGGRARWATVNGWFYASPIADDPTRHPALDAVARTTLATRAWRAEADRWFETARPRVVAANRELQSEELSELDDLSVLDHLRRAVDHFTAVAPHRFEHVGAEIAVGLLFLEAGRWGVPVADLAALLGGASPVAASADAHVDRIAGALR